MAISRKGMRKIVVNDKIYYYKIYHSCKCFFWCECTDPRLTIVIEKPDGKVVTHNKHQRQHNAFTPKDVRVLIEELNESKEGH